MRLTVLNVAYPAAPVDADPVGGAEQILAHLDRALLAAGHRSLVIACEGSQTAGTLIPTPRPPDDLTPEARRELARSHQRAIHETLRTQRVDVIHLHGLDCLSYLPQQPVPTLVTLHLPTSWYPAEIFGPLRRGVYLNCVSHSQLEVCPESDHLIGVVENGVDLDRLRPVAPDGDFVLVLGRICSEKGQHAALDAAHRADVPLVIAGTVFPYAEHVYYYRTQILPRLDPRRRFIGPVQGLRKTQLLAAARCLLVPSTVAETSSLVAMEALACGTPVVAFSSGALPEVVHHGETGLLVSTAEEMAAAIAAVDRLDRQACRRAAEQRFSAARMCRQYLQIYRRISAADQLPASVLDDADGATLTAGRRELGS